MFQRVRGWLPFVYALALLWLNAYLVRQVFFLTFTGATHSMHGYWAALGRVVGGSWLIPQWVPYWAGGMPAELTYAPLIPWLGSLWGIYPAMAAVFVIGPAAVYLMAWQLSGKPGWAFVTGVAYSLLAPTELARILEPRRMYLTLVWDEAPHQLALAMVCLAVAAWARGWRSAAIVGIALAALANPFGVTGAVIFGLVWVLTARNWRMVLISGVVSYLLVSPFYPPSMLGILRANGELAPESAWTRGSLLALVGVAGGLAVLHRLTREWEPIRRFAALLTWVTLAIPVIYSQWNIVLLQQPARYQSEAELALVLLGVFGAERLLANRPRWLLAGLAVIGIALAGQQTIRHRLFSRNSFRQMPMDTTIEYQAAQVIPGTVFTAGSLAHWMNAFDNVRQYSGGAYTTSPNPMQQRISLQLTGERSWEKFVQWMQAVGVDNVLIPGPKSPEFWKPFATDVLAGHLSVLWEERDTRLYIVPRHRRTMVHAVPGLLPLDAYVKAIEDPSAPDLRLEWLTPNRGVVHGTWPATALVLVHMNWHKGWKVYLNGKEVPAKPDEWGQMAIAPGGTGRLELVFTGAREAWVTRLLCLGAMIYLVAGAIPRSFFSWSTTLRA